MITATLEIGEGSEIPGGGDSWEEQINKRTMWAERFPVQQTTTSGM